MAVTIGFLVAITSNFAIAFNKVYGFEAWQAGLCFLASPIGALIGAYFGGHLSDQIADRATHRNGGIREPEMRLPAMTISVLTSPLSLVLYGVGIGNGMHWMVPTLGLGLCEFKFSSGFLSLISERNIDLKRLESELFGCSGHEHHPSLYY
jgi:MFS family permease